MQEQLDALPGLVMERLTGRRRPLANTWHTTSSSGAVVTQKNYRPK